MYAAAIKMPKKEMDSMAYGVQDSTDDLMKELGLKKISDLDPILANMRASTDPLCVSLSRVLKSVDGTNLLLDYRTIMNNPDINVETIRNIQRFSWSLGMFPTLVEVGRNIEKLVQDKLLESVWLHEWYKFSKQYKYDYYTLICLTMNLIRVIIARAYITHTQN